MRATRRNIIVVSLAVAVLLCGRALAGGLGELKTIDLRLRPGERSVTRLLIGPDGAIYGEASVDGAEEPRLFRYDPAKGGPPELVDALPQEDGVSAYALSATGALQHRLPDGTLEELGQVAGTRPFEPKGYQISRALFGDADGNVYTAGEGGAIYRYSPQQKKLEALDARLPAVVGREPWASLDAAVLRPDGLVYGGTFDGYLFTFDLETHEVVNLGKPLRQQRIRGLAFSRGKLYGVGGEEEGLQRSFAVDLETRGFELGGTLKSEVQFRHLYDPVGAMVADEDGNIYLGMTGRLGNLFVWERGEE